MSHGYRFLTRGLVLLGTAAALGAGLAHPAKADNGVPAISQYVESMPTAGGTSGGVKTRANSVGGISRAVARRVAAAGGSDKSALTNLVKTAPPLLRPAQSARLVAPDRRSTFSALADGSGRALLFVALGIIGSAVFAGALAGARRSRVLSRS